MTCYGIRCGTRYKRVGAQRSRGWRGWSCRAADARGGSGAGRRGIGALLVSATVSRLADQSASIALVLLVIARTHNPRLAGLVVAAFTVPTLVTGPVIGAYLDRLKAKRALFAANQVTLAAALAGVAVLAGHAPGTVLIALGLLAGLTAPVLTGGFSSLVPLLVPPSRLGAPTRSTPPATTSPGWPAWPWSPRSRAPPEPGWRSARWQASRRWVSCWCLASRCPPPRRILVTGLGAIEPAQAVAGSLRGAVADGLRLLRDVPVLRSTTIATTLSMLSQGLLPVTLPLLAVRLDHPALGRRVAADRSECAAAWRVRWPAAGCWPGARLRRC